MTETWMHPRGTGTTIPARAVRRLLMAERSDNGSSALTAGVRRVARIHLHDDDAHGVTADRRARLHGAVRREHAHERRDAGLRRRRAGNGSGCAAPEPPAADAW